MAEPQSVTGFDTTGDGRLDSFDTNGDGEVDVVAQPTIARCQPLANTLEAQLSDLLDERLSSFDHVLNYMDKKLRLQEEATRGLERQYGEVAAAASGARSDMLADLHELEANVRSRPDMAATAPLIEQAQRLAGIANAGFCDDVNQEENMLSEAHLPTTLWGLPTVCLLPQIAFAPR